MELARSLGRLAGQLAGRGEPALEVTVVNLSGREVRLPRSHTCVARGELRLAPAVFEVLEALRPGSSGALLFCAGGSGAAPAAAVELLLDSGEAQHRLRVGYAAAGVGRGRFAVQWAAAAAACGSLACFLEELPAAAALGALASGDTDDGPVRTDGFVAWVSRTSTAGGPLGSVTITLRPRDEAEVLARPICSPGPQSELGEAPPAPLTLRAAQQRRPSARPSTAPLLARRKWLLINVVNYAGVGLTFPPDYAQLWAGEAWKEMTYLGPQQSGLLAFGDDLHFSGQAFCSLGDRRGERLYFEASNPRVGPNTFSVHFEASSAEGGGASGGSSSGSSSGSGGSGGGSGGAGGLAAAAGAALTGVWGLQAAVEALAGGFLGVPADATVCGEDFEALVTDARYGDGALATVAVYPRLSTAASSSTSTSSCRTETSSGNT